MLALFFLLALSACSPFALNKNLVLLDENLVGTWEYDNTDIIDILASEFANSLRDSGYSKSEVYAAASIARILFAENPGPVQFSALRFDANGSYADNSGSIGA